MSPLHLLFFLNCHIIPEIVKAKFTIRSVRDIFSISLKTLFLIHEGRYNSNGQAHAIVDRSHPFRISGGQIVIYRNDMDSPCRDGV